jgi:pimeloyl-ACP methyl ester carboxylesterase
VRLVCRDGGGPGVPLLLLHGLAGHCAEWDPLADMLAARYRVVALDQRGHGRSERRPPDVSRTAYVEDAAFVADQLGLVRPVLVGQSLGGHTAMLVAATHPELARALVMIEAGPGGPEPETPSRIGAWLGSWPTPFPTRQDAVEFLGGAAVGEAWAAGLEQRPDGWRPRFERDVMVAVLSENAERSHWPEWARFRCPILLILAQPSIIPGADVDRMLREQPDTRAVSVLGTGHDLHLEQPAAVHAAISDFPDFLDFPAAGA